MIDGALVFTIAISIIGGEEEGEQNKPVLIHCRSELALVGGGVRQFPLQSLRTRGEARMSKGNNCNPLSRVSISNLNGFVKQADFSREEVAA